MARPALLIPLVILPFVMLAAASAPALPLAQDVTLDSIPPVVIRTVPEAGSRGVDPALAEIRVTFSKPMTDNAWSWTTLSPDSFPKPAGPIRFDADGRTCVLPVRLEPNRTYAIGINYGGQARNFKDATGQPALPWILSFRTK